MAQLDPLVVNAGELRHQVTVQKPTMGQSGTGAPVTTWDDVLTTMAAIMTASSREVYQAAQFTAQVSHVLKIRWPGPGIVLSGGMQVTFGSRTFKLQTVENVLERNRVMLLHCLELNGLQGGDQ